MQTPSTKPYGRTTWTGIIENDPVINDLFSDEAFRVDDDGVWVLPVEPDLDWHPFWDLDDPIGRDPSRSPHLPFPFSAADLAAFMLDGVGAFIAERFGDWESGPDQDELDSFGARAKTAVHAIESAYRICKQAMGQVGCKDQSHAAQAKALDDRLRSDRLQARADNRLDAWKSSPEFKLLKDDLAKAQRADAASHKAWRREMVRYLFSGSTGLSQPTTNSNDSTPATAEDQAAATNDPSQHSESPTQLFTNFPDEPRKPNGQVVERDHSERTEDKALQSQQESAPLIPTSATLHELPAARRQRRLAEFREMGANMVRHGDGWLAEGRGAIAKLARKERENGIPQSGDADVRRDLIAATEQEENKKRRGELPQQ